MRIFGTTQPIYESSELSYKIGRLVANYEFFISLFCYSGFDEYHIFCPNYNNADLTSRRIKRENIPEEIKKRIKVFHICSLKKMVRQNDYYVFHVCGWGFYFPGLIHLRNSHARKLFPVTGIIHSLNSSETAYHALKTSLAPALPFDSIICSSECGKIVMKNLFDDTSSNFSDADYRGRFDRIPLGISPDFSEVPDKNDSRGGLGINTDDLVILTLGRLTPSKKMDFGPLFKTIKKVSMRTSKNIVFILAGSADKREELLIKNMLREYGIEDITRLAVNFDNSLKKKLYAASDIYAAPVDNLQETFGLSVAEAMACGCVPVISDFNGYSELVEDGKTGIKVPSYWTDISGLYDGMSELINFSTYQLLISQSIVIDMHKMESAIIELDNNPEKMEKISEAASVKARTDYLWPSIIKRYCGLWKELSENVSGYSKKPERKTNPWEINHFKNFRHYVTAEIKMTSIIEKAGNTKIPVPYSDVGASLINPEVIKFIISKMPAKALKASGLYGIIKSNVNLSEQEFMFCISWSCKYGLMRIVEI
ncbi:MAG: glycosyltransferase family 4 protein [Fibrobacterota bacterium]